MLVDAIWTGERASTKKPRLKDPSKLLARIAALPFNQFLTNDVGQLREKYNIPTNELDDEEQRVLLGLWTDDTDNSEFEEDLDDNFTLCQ